MKAEMKEFKVTCQGCGNVRFVPYVDFIKAKQEDSGKGKTFLGNILFSLGLGTVCLPLGCCSGLLSVGDVTAKNKTPEQQQEKYFQIYKVNRCNKCGSFHKKVEVINHNLDEIGS